MYHIEDRLEWTCAELSAVVKVCRHTAPCCYPFVFSLGARCLPAGGGREGVCKRRAIFRSSFHLPRAELHSRNRMHEHTSCGHPPARTLTRAFIVSRRPGAHNDRAKANHVLDQIRCTHHSQTQALFLSDPWRIYGSGDHQGLDSHWKKWEAHASDRVDVPQRVDLTPGKGPAPHRVRHQRRRHLHLPISEQTRTRFWGTRWSCSMRWLGWPSASTRTRKSRAHAPTQLSAVGRTCTPPPPHRTHACLCFAAAYALHLHVYARRATCARTQARATLLNIVDSTSRCTVCRPTMRACQPDPLESRRQRLNLREKTQRNTCVDFTLFSCKRAL
jgi:hypothetical protein